MLIAFGKALFHRFIASHFLDDARHIVIAFGDLDHAIGEATVIDLDGIEEIGRSLHFRDDITHFFVERFEQILKRDGGRGLKNAFQLLHQIVRVKEGHAAQEHVDAATACLHLGQGQRHKIVVMDIDAPGHAASGHIAARLVLKGARRGVGHIVEPAFRPALGIGRSGRAAGGEKRADRQ